MFRTALAAAGLAAALLAAPAVAQEDAELYFITPADGASVSSPVTIRFGLRNFGVAPAGVEREGTGHHHVLVDRAPWGAGEEDAEIAETGIPSDEHHVHFGGGQTETTLDLPPGEHTLQLLMGDAFHVPHDPAIVSQRIVIMVE